MQLDLNDHVKELNDSTCIYKYFSECDFIKYILNDKTLLFKNVKNWKDSHEGRLKEFIEQTKRIETQQYLGCCWSLEQDDSLLYKDWNDGNSSANADLKKYGSDALWQIYSGNCGVRIQTTIGKVKQAIKSSHNIDLIKHGQVVYLPDFVNGLATTNVNENALFIKRIPFRHEMEYRFIVKDKNCQNSNVIININPFDLIDEVLISPGIGSDEAKIRSLYNKLTSHQCFGSYKVQISQLYGYISQEIT